MFFESGSLFMKIWSGIRILSFPSNGDLVSAVQFFMFLLIDLSVHCSESLLLRTEIDRSSAWPFQGQAFMLRQCEGKRHSTL